MIGEDPTERMLKQVRAKVDDREHAILYKSPGPHRGMKGKSIDHRHVKSKAEAAEAIAEGWSATEEDAYELADALKAQKKGKKAAAPADEDEEDEEAEDDGEDDLGLAEEPPKAKAKAKKKGKR